MESRNLPIEQALRSLRAELASAIRQAESESLKFSVESVELQLQVVATTAGGANAGLGLWQVLTLGAKIDHSRAATHLVKLVLKPQLDGKSNVEVGDDLASWRPAIPAQGN
ncbi:trypco2 family protein [Micromonospora gifhornensis]|uniref:trypco2 family protein n=1 Tax=Micromonospora gifhornensis TaxID=84594 RepID=UPI003452E58F